MNKLTEQIENICDEINIGQANHENNVAIEAYTAMLDDCMPVVDRIESSKIQRSVLNSELDININSVIELDEQDKHETVVACWYELDTAWMEEDYNVKQGGTFSKFFTAARTYEKALADNNWSAFKLWISERVAEIEVPEAALDTQRKIPHLEPVVKNYDRYYGQFKQLVSNLPTLDSARTLLDLLEHIQSTKSEMEFDLPEPVKKFFQALQASFGGGGAPLNLLTEEVRNWLEEHQQTDNYVIRRKGQSSW